MGVRAEMQFKVHSMLVGAMIENELILIYVFDVHWISL